MRITVLVLALLGSLIAGALGIMWMDDAGKSQKILKKNQALLSMAKKSPTFQAKFAKMKAKVDQRRTGSYLLLLTFLLAIVGGVFAFRRQGKVAAGLFAVAFVLPAVIAPATLIFNFLLIIAFALSFFVKAQTTTVPA